MLVQILWLVFGAPPALAAAGSYNLKWYAADPAVNKGPYLPTYPKVPPTQLACPTPSGSAGRAANPLTDAIAYATPAIASNLDAVTSLAPKDMALGQIVPFELEITVNGSTTTEGGVIRVTPEWLAKTTSGDDFGFDPDFLPTAGNELVYCAFVDTGDPGTSDPGNNAKVDSWTETLLQPGTNNERIQGEFTISGLNDGDKVVVEIWVVLKDTIPAKATGNVQTALVSAQTGSSGRGDTINTGNQTVPLLRVQEFFTADADLSITKADGPDPVALGSQLTYTVSVKNNSADTVANGVVATDTLDPNTTFVSATSVTAGVTCSHASGVVTCNVGSLAPGQEVTITITVVVKTTAPTAGTIQTGTCTVGATGVDLCNRVSVTAITSDPTTANNSDSEPTNVIGTPSLTLVKTALPATYNTVGQTISYSYLVTNNGNVTIQGPITVTDDKASVTCPALSPNQLAPGASTTCTATYTITQADLDGGSVKNTARASGTFNGGAVLSNFDDETVTAGREPALTIEKTASPLQYSAVGQTITYSYKLTNSGNVTLPGPFSVSDDKLGTISPCGSGPLAPGAFTTCTATYTITQANLNAGSITNIAYATTTYNGATVTSNSDDATVTAVQAPNLTLLKTATPSNYSAAGQAISYSYLVTNNGNVTIQGPITVTDNKASVTCPALSPNQLAPGASTTCAATYTITQADVDAGLVTNIARAKGSFNGSDVLSNEDQETVTADQTPSLSLDKVADPKSYDAVGDVIAYDYIVTNNGNVTIQGPITVSDNKATVTCPALSPDQLAPGASTTCTATYTITQADLDSGEVKNTAKAKGSFNGADVFSNVDTETVDAIQSPVLTLDKSADVASYDSVGDVINYTYKLTNGGNVTLSAPYAVTDNKVSVTCPNTPASLPPGASVDCNASYTIKQSDLDAGEVKNTATATAQFGGTTVTSNEDDVTVDADQRPALAIVKQATPTTYDSVGDVISYSYKVTNVGNVTIQGPITVTDDKASVTCPALSPNQLAPGAFTTCAATYTITQADLNGGEVTNTAYASGTFNDKPVNSPPDSETVEADQKPAIDLTKTASPTQYDAVGDGISYTLTAKNTGNVTLSGVTIVDPTLGALSCTPPLGSSLDPGATMTCTGSYTIKLSDLDLGKVDNTATATGTFGGTNYTDQDTETVTGIQLPGLMITKSPDLQQVAIGGTATFTILVKNTGNVTMSNIKVADALVPSCDKTIGSLAPGQETSYTCTFSPVTADFRNVATVTGTSPGGVDRDDEDTADVDALPEISVTKAPSVGSVPETGANVTFTFTVTNDSSENVTITGLTDSKFGALAGDADCAVGTVLAPGASCSFQLTKPIGGDFPGSHTNTFTATAKDDEGNSASDDDTATVAYTDVLPAVTVKKEADKTSVPETGGSVTFTFTVTNNSTEAAEITVLSDSDFGTLAGDADCKLGTVLAAGASCSFTLTRTISGDFSGPDHQNTFTATVKDDDGNTDSDDATETVELTDVKPDITIVKTANPASVPETGGSVTFTFKVTNNAAEAATLTSLVDDKLGNLDGKGTCAVPQSLAANGGTYTCAVTTSLSGDTGNDHVNTVTAKASDDDGNEDTATDTETVGFTDVLPTIEVTKTAGTASVPETGGSVTFTFVVTNTSGEPVEISSLSDNKLGTLAGDADCKLGTTLAAGASCEFTVTTTLSGNAGTSHTNIFTGKAKDDEGNTATDTDDATVAFTDVLPTIEVTKTADKASVPETGGSVTFTFVVTNTSGEPVAISSLSDNKLGTLAGDADCKLGTTLAAGASCSFTVVATLSGDAPNTHVNIFTAAAKDDEGNTATDTDDATVAFTDVLPDITITKTANPTSVPFSGANVTFTFAVKNNGAEAVTLSSLTDDKFGDLSGQGSCSVPQTILPGATYTCAVVKFISGTPTATGIASHVNVATAVASDDDGNSDTATDDATVTFTWRGRTPGFWKNRTSAWPTNFTLVNYQGATVTVRTTTLVRSVFNVPTGGTFSCVGSKDTLLKALDYGGSSTLCGGTQILLRAATAALLNERTFGNDYPPYATVSDLVSAVNAAIATGDRATIITLANQLDYWNNGVH